MRIAIMGAGSLGIIIGAYLQKGNQDVELIHYNKAHVKVLNEKGGTITGAVEENVKVKAITNEEMNGNYDLVLLLTKQGANKDVLHQLKSHLHEDSVVLSLQNGIPEDDIASVVGKDKVIGGSVEFGATLKEYGVSELTTEYNTFKAHSFQIGELDGTVTERIIKIKEIMDLIGGTEITENLIGTKWSKLLVNASMSGMSAAIGGTFGDVLKEDIAIISAIMIANETLEVGEKAGVDFAKLQGVDLRLFKLNDDRSNLPQLIAIMRKVFEPQSMLKASMLQDLVNKKGITEVDFINGAVVSQSKKVGVKTPFNNLVVNIVKEAEGNKTVPTVDKTLPLFKELIK